MNVRLLTYQKLMAEAELSETALSEAALSEIAQIDKYCRGGSALLVWLER
jgi:hypothetical protein